MAPLKSKVKSTTKSFNAISSILYWSVEDSKCYSIKFNTEYTGFNVNKDSFAMIIAAKDSKVNYKYSLHYITDWCIDSKSRETTTINFRTVASPTTKVPSEKGKGYRNFRKGDSQQQESIGLITHSLIQVVVFDSITIVKALFVNHPLLLQKEKKWDEFRLLSFKLNEQKATV
eukprot:551334_1